jgi:uncharacterized damage-inducible protein DinB
MQKDSAAFLKELCAFNRETNALLFPLLNNPELSEPNKSIELMSHILNAHKIWNNRILKTEAGVRPADLYQVESFHALNDENYFSSLEILLQYSPETIVAYQNSRGVACSNSVRDILFHIINHSTHHRAQISSELRNSGLQPPITDYLYWVGM